MLHSAKISNKTKAINFVVMKYTVLLKFHTHCRQNPYIIQNPYLRASIPKLMIFFLHECQ